MKCPSCKTNDLDPNQVMNALSRRDNKTYICSPCGTKEAMEDFEKRTKPNPTILKWLTPSESEGYEDNQLGGLGGFFKEGMRWKDYLNQYKEVAHPRLETLRKSIIENHIRCTGEEMQESGLEVVPLWSDQTVTTYSWRAWGDLMAAVYSEEDNKDYHYMDFYM